MSTAGDSSLKTKEDPDSTAQITFPHTEKNQCWLNNLALWKINTQKIKQFSVCFSSGKGN